MGFVSTLKKSLQGAILGLCIGAGAGAAWFVAAHVFARICAPVEVFGGR